MDTPQKRLQAMIEQRRRERPAHLNFADARVAANERAIRELRRIIEANALKDNHAHGKEGE